MYQVARLVRRTEHFLFHFRADTAAERNVALLDARLAAVRDATLDLLALPRVDQAPIPVYLFDSPDEELPPVEAPAGAAVGPATRRLTGVYGDDVAGAGLERGLVELLLVTSLGEQVGRSAFISFRWLPSDFPLSGGPQATRSQRSARSPEPRPSWSRAPPQDNSN